MKRPSHRLLSLLAVLLLLAGLWVPAAPAQAEGSCPDGQFRYTDSYDQNYCAPLPHRASVGFAANATWEGNVYLQAGTYEFEVEKSSVFGAGSTSLAIGGSVVLGQSSQSRVASYKVEADGLYPIRLDAGGVWGLTVSLRWRRTDPCSSGSYKVGYYYGDGSLAYETCSSTLGGSWPDGVPTEVALFDPEAPDYWYAEYTGKLATVAGTPLPASSNNIYFTLSIGNDAWDDKVPSPFWPGQSGTFDVHLALRPLDPGKAASFSLMVCAPGYWTGVYYNDPAGTGNPDFIVCEARPDYSWPSGSPGPWAGYGTIPDVFHARWSSSVSFDEGAYRFFVQSDQHFQLSVNGEVVLQGDSAYDAASTTLDLESGTYTITFAYANAESGAHTGERFVRLWWERVDSPGIKPPRCPAGTLLAEYTSGGGATTDFATCEAPTAEWGKNHPERWNDLATYSIKWSGDVVLPAGTYTFTADIGSGESAWLELNDHRVLNSSGSTQYKLQHGTYRLEAKYTGGGRQGPISWKWDQLGAEGPCNDFRLTYRSDPLSILGDACQPLLLPAREEGGPFYVGTPRSVTWEGKINFAPGRYVFYGPDSGMKLRLWKAGTGEDITLDRWDAGDEEPVERDLAGEYSLQVDYRLEPGRPQPRVWWSVKDAPELVSYRYISHPGESRYEIELAFDQDVRYAGSTESATHSFFLHENGEPVEIAAVSAAGNKVTLAVPHDGGVGEIGLSYFPSTEEDAIQGVSSQPARVELAAGKPVTGGGGTNTAPVSGAAGPGENPTMMDALVLNASNDSWQVDLGYAYWLDEARLGITQNPGAGSLTASVSVDGEEWTDAATLNLAPGQTSPSLDLSGRQARHVRLTYSPAESNHKLFINRFQVLGSPGGAVVGFIPPLRFAPDETAPKLVERIDGKEKVELNVDLIMLTYDEPLDTRSVPELTDYTVTVGTETCHPTGVVVQDNAVTLYLPVAVRFEQSVKLTYTPGDSPVRDLLGYEAEGFTDKTVDPVLTEMTNLARYGSPEATQSSDFGDQTGSGAPNAIDGRTDVGSRTKMEQSPWWQIDLGKVSTLFDLKLFVHEGFRERPPRYQILLSDDGELWTPAYLHDGSGFGAEGLTIDLNGQKARYLRISTSSFTELDFIEIEIWGYPPRYS